MWKRNLALCCATSLIFVTLVSPVAAAPGLTWGGCRERAILQQSGRELQCARLEVPLDYGNPAGPTIKLMVTRLMHTSAPYQGVMVTNPGGPGSSGFWTAAQTAQQLPARVADAYDWIGFDPRGVGQSEPSLTCDPGYLDPGTPRADYVPRTLAEEQAWLGRAKAFAADCQAKYGDILPHLGTRTWVRDLESIRLALRTPQLNYFGYSYGTYLGTLYASQYPTRVRRMVVDGVVRPSTVWYDAQGEQNKAFQKRMNAFFAWIAKHDDVYGLGDTRRRVELAYYGMRNALAAKPVGRIGPDEFDDALLPAGYADWKWPSFARTLSDWSKGDAAALTRWALPPSADDQNTFTMYNAVQCRDAAWPKDWQTWKYDAQKQYGEGVRYNTWSNTWYNAPCLFWPTASGPLPKIGGDAELLIAHSTRDAATPYEGAVEMHRLFPKSRMLVEEGGGNHANSLGNTCMRALISAYLDDGTLPPTRKGPDAICAKHPDPVPAL
ncbi:MAG: alpha/beta hydrolase [Streptosporangiaceae bacterium]